MDSVQTPLRQVQAETATASAHLFAPRSTVRYRVYSRDNGRRTPGYVHYKMTGPVTVAYKPTEDANGVKGEDLLDAGKNPPEKFRIWQIIRGESHELTLDDKVDVRAPGVEKFRTLSRTQMEG